MPSSDSWNVSKNVLEKILKDIPPTLISDIIIFKKTFMVNSEYLILRIDKPKTLGTNNSETVCSPKVCFSMTSYCAFKQLLD